MRRNLDYVYTLLISYPRATTAILALYAGFVIFSVMVNEKLGIMMALSAAISNIFLMLCMKIMLGASIRKKKFGDLDSTPILFLALTIFILLVIGLIVGLPYLRLAPT